MAGERSRVRSAGSPSIRLVPVDPRECGSLYRTTFNVRVGLGERMVDERPATSRIAGEPSGTGSGTFFAATRRTFAFDGRSDGPPGSRSRRPADATGP